MSPSASSLTPFYRQQIQKPTTILETLQWHFGRRGTNTVTKGHTLFDHIFNVSSMSQSADLGAHIQNFGADVIRMSLVFREKTAEGPDIDEAGIASTQRWFQSIWRAVTLAHGSYISTQRCPDEPSVPEALNEPGLESWLNYVSEEHLLWIQVPPEEPEVPSSSPDIDMYRLWLVAQKAIFAYSAPITARNSLQTIGSRLVRLTNAIKAYDKAYMLDCNMHYYSARVLISLLAPLAPSFAEECWVLLHYGCQDGDNDDDGTDPRCRELDEEMIEDLIKEAEDVLGRKNLPRQGQPDTLQSIFVQPFPLARLQASDSPDAETRARRLPVSQSALQGLKR